MGDRLLLIDGLTLVVAGADGSSKSRLGSYLRFGI